MKLVMDTNLLVSAFLWPGVPADLLDLAVENELLLYTSATLLEEFREVLLRPKLSNAVAASGFDAAALFQRYKQIATLVSSRKLTQKVCRDADDDHVLACALAAKAELIITGDKDLLVLHPWRGIHIMSPAAALNKLKRIG
jgi:uncharacterized protein